MNKQELQECKDLAKRIRKHTLRMVCAGKSGHIGSMLSTADIYPVLYKRFLKVDPKNPKWADRDRFLLSKGHGGAALLACLAECGFFPKDWLNRYYCDDGKLSGHISHHIPGVEFSTGSLGHGLPVACGMAMAAKRDGKSHRIVVMSSDGDLNEGSTWEAIMLAGQHHYDNLTMLVDYNRIQALGYSKDIIDLEPLGTKLEMFGWKAVEVDGQRVENQSVGELLKVAKYFASISPSLTLALERASAACWYSASVALVFFATLAARVRAVRLV